MKVMDCNKCRKQMQKECEVCQYEMFTAIVNDIVKAATVAFIGVLHRRELSEGYIRKFYEDFLLVLDCPEVFGSPVKSDELQKLYSEKYKIDFERIKCNYDSFDEYRHK